MVYLRGSKKLSDRRGEEGSIRPSKPLFFFFFLKRKERRFYEGERSVLHGGRRVERLIYSSAWRTFFF